MAGAALSFRPVTAATRDDFLALFESPGAPKHCWCMVWRVTPQEARTISGPRRRPLMLARIARNEPVGLLGYDDDVPVAWVSVAPKDSYRRLGGPDPQPGESVWSLACMFVRRAYRGQGLAHRLIAAAADHAAAAGATVLEAYPVDADSPSYRFMGFVDAFGRAGFAEVGTAGSRRHVMRLTLPPDRQAKA